PPGVTLRRYPWIHLPGTQQVGDPRLRPGPGHLGSIQRRGLPRGRSNRRTLLLHLHHRLRHRVAALGDEWGAGSGRSGRVGQLRVRGRGTQRQCHPRLVGVPWARCVGSRGRGRAVDGAFQQQEQCRPGTSGATFRGSLPRGGPCPVGRPPRGRGRGRPGTARHRDQGRIPVVGGIRRGGIRPIGPNHCWVQAGLTVMVASDQPLPGPIQRLFASWSTPTTRVIFRRRNWLRSPVLVFCAVFRTMKERGPRMNEQEHPPAVVVGVDETPAARAALDWAADAAERRGAQLRIVHGLGTPAVMATYAGSESYVVLEEHREYAHTLLTDSAAHVHSTRPELRVTTVLAPEAAPAALLGEACHGDIIVVGSRGLGGVRAIMLGSVSARTSSAAP